MMGIKKSSEPEEIVIHQTFDLTLKVPQSANRYMWEDCELRSSSHVNNLLTIIELLHIKH